MNPRYRVCAMIALTGAFGFVSSRAFAQIIIDVKYHCVLNPADGQRPPGPDGVNPILDSDIDAAVGTANGLLRSFGRGYQLRRVGAVADVGGQGGTARPSPSFYFNIDFFADDSPQNDMQSDALSNPTMYAWQSSAINIYFTNGMPNHGSCAFPAHTVMVIGGRASSDGAVHLHEIGHFFNLCHTQGCLCNCCIILNRGCEEPGDDAAEDTLEDMACWGRDNIAVNEFGRVYDQLHPFNQREIDDVFDNVMSWHRAGFFDHVVCTSLGGLMDRMTERQLDRWADAASTDRIGQVSGRTIFLSPSGNTCLGPLCPSGRSTDPFRLIQEAIDHQNPQTGDILLLRAGVYHGQAITITRPLILLSPRGRLNFDTDFSAVIGPP